MCEAAEPKHAKNLTQWKKEYLIQQTIEALKLYGFIDNKKACGAPNAIPTGMSDLSLPTQFFISTAGNNPIITEASCIYRFSAISTEPPVIWKDFQ